MTLATITTTKRFVCIYSGTDLHTVFAQPIGTSVDIDDSFSYIEHDTTILITAWMTTNSIETASGYAPFQIPIDIALDDSENTPNPERVALDAAIDVPIIVEEVEEEDGDGGPSETP